MKVILSKSEVTCLDLEKELGLARGGVKSMHRSVDGQVFIELDKEPTAAQKTKLESIFNMKVASVEGGGKG